MNISAWSIDRPIPIILFFIILSLGGLIAFESLAVQDYPDVDLPAITISTALPGAASEQIEAEVTERIENAISTLSGLKHISSVVNDGSTVTTVIFQLEKPLEQAYQEVSAVVSGVRSKLPNDATDSRVKKITSSSQPILIFSVRSESMSMVELSWFVDHNIINRISVLNGVEEVKRIGGGNRQIHVELNPVRLNALNVTASAITQRLRKIQIESSGGVSTLNGTEQVIRTDGNVHSLDELAAIEIPFIDGRSFRLDQLADIRDTIEDNPSIALLDGKPVIAFQIARSKGAGVIEVANQVDQAIRNLRADFPNIHIARITDFVSPVEESFSGSVRMFVEGTFLVIFVVWLFLRNSRATLISALALPLSVLPVFIGMYFLGYTLNLVTLLALSLVIGILVDDAIVEIENIIRYLRIEHSPRTATINATQEIGLAVIATTFAMIAVFFPTAFMKGITGLYFRQFGVTATIAVFSSLAVARLLTPMMSAHLLKLSPEKETRQNNIKMVYLRFVEWCLDHRIWTLVGVLLFFFGSLFLSGFLAKDFMPRIEDPQTQVMIEMAPGAQESEILALSEEVRQKISSIPVVKAVFSVIGAPVSSESGRNSMETYRKATLNVILGPSKDREKSNEEIESEISRLLSRVPGVRIKVGPRGSQRHVFAFQLMSADPHLLSLTARKVEGELKTIPGFGSITSTVSELRPELLIRPDFAKIADLGVSTQDIGDTLRVSTIGDYEAYLPKLNLGQQRIPIALIIKPESLSQIQLVKMLRVPSANSKTGTVELGQVAEVRLTTGVGSINRFNYSRVAKFEVELIGVDLVDAADSVARMRSIQSLPKGITRLDIGDAEELNDLFHGFGFAMLAGVVVIYIIMALLFTDFLQPITILSALPLSFGGGFIALLLTGKALSMPALIGMVMLIGIATKNSILLVDYCIIYKNGRGATFREAIIDACRHRATPIIMTSIAMAVGMLPIAIGTGSSDSEFRSQMAIAVIGGLFTSTFLSLLVVPVVYLTIEDFRSYIMSRFRK
ncbi:efflux RND transporter permease subunit [Candidatus Methylospira mobilis]|uniref:Efflux RND transporter permease subunit n=1 Tax=Candidatus Methylospira mobilis TaxID=1808979 RepID=A0A5Q0BDZ5_9GAMM|nr:efflux RND transporter permease subunit [Candidatus Methylospira mobilis]QFY41352.1 efflux RND transporter permease subunit [Candidatus Methylospira mobilis]